MRQLMTNPNRPPLWEAMAEACANHPDGVVDLRAAVIQDMIRAARDWLLPEEEHYKALFPSLPANPVDNVLVSQRGQRQALREILTTEAERAEKGE